MIGWIKNEGLPPISNEMVLNDTLENAQKQLEEFQRVTALTDVCLFTSFRSNVTCCNLNNQGIRENFGLFVWYLRAFRLNRS